MSTEREERLQRALRRVARRAFWFTLCHPLAAMLKTNRAREHEERTLAEFRQEMGHPE